MLNSFYYLLHVCEHMIKGHCNNTKQTIQFVHKVSPCSRKMCMGTYNKWVDMHPLQTSSTPTVQCLCLRIKIMDEKVFVSIKKLMDAHYTAPFMPWVAYISSHSSDMGTYLLVFLITEPSSISRTTTSGQSWNLAALLHYPATHSIPINMIDTHSLCSGRANALSLLDGPECKIQKFVDFPQEISLFLHWKQ
jgi:hypothetical protein